MKRSEYIALGAAGMLLVAVVWPRNQQPLPGDDPALNAGRNDGFQTLAFASLAECKDAQAVTSAICDEEYARASQASVADAPKYEALADCEAEYGASQCRPATWNGASVFIPAMAGVLIARSLAGAAVSQPLYPPRTGQASCPSGVSLAERPECGQRSSGSSGGGSASSGRSYYSTGSGRAVGRVLGSAVADIVLPSRTTVSRTTVSRTAAARGGSWSGGTATPSAPRVSTPSTTVSRGGFGSTSSSFSSGS